MKTWTLAAVAELTGAELIGDPDHTVSAVADLESATATTITFLANPRYLPLLSNTAAGAILVAPDTKQVPGKNYLLHPSPSEAFQKLIETFLQDQRLPSAFAGIHPTAIIHPSATIGENVTIGPYTVIDQQVTIGSHTTIGSHVAIGPGCHIGEHCLLHPHTTLREHCTLGNRVVIQPGAVIGSCGFGYTTDAKGKHTQLAQLGTVILEDDVDVGANTTIDRGRFQPTRIGAGTKIDNQVQIAHGVTTGRDNLIIAQTGVAGSTHLGNNVTLAAQVGIAGHLRLTDRVIVAARGGVTKSLSKPGVYSGAPAQPHALNNRNTVLFRNLHKLLKNK
ncbi:MAG: UDP-3-O-(3-hydroxymyristoyl)glucosamine N-acyltransferase [Chlamydiia bacterium]|nr:UDP-3-O-(3-hydroxymyristoyl)glucosamine N-acyltransferase [Chlamydiia bacterium]